MNLLDGLVGRVPGSTGETSVVALVLGGAFLLWRGVVGWHIPAAFLGSVAALAAAAPRSRPGGSPAPAFTW